MSNIKHVGFDFDDTLTKPLIQMRAYGFVLDGYEVYVITKRPNTPEYAPEVYALAKSLKIKQENVYFTSNGIKSPYIKNLDISLFYDDDPENKLEIESNTDCKVILV